MAYGRRYSELKPDYPSLNTEEDELDIQIKNEKDVFRKSLLEERRKKRNEEQKQKVEEMKAKADELGLDPLDYYDKLKKGEIQEQQPQDTQSGGSFWSSINNFIANVTGVTKSEEARNQAVQAAEDSQKQIADQYRKTELLYANTTDPVEKDRLQKRLDGMKQNFAQVENLKQTSMQPNWAENLIRHPVKTTWEGGTDLLFGGVKTAVSDLADMHYYTKNLNDNIAQQDEIQKQINAEQDPTKKKQLQSQLQMVVEAGKGLRENAPAAVGKTDLQNAGTGLMAGIDIATLGLGDLVIKSGLKLGEKTIGKEALEAGLKKVAGEKALERFGLVTAEKETEKALQKSLAEKISQVAAESKSIPEFTKRVSAEVAKTLPKAIGNENTIAAISLGAGYGASSALQNGETDMMTIAKEAAKGALMGWGLERGTTGLLKGGAAIHAAEKDFSVKLETAKRLDQKPTLKEKLAMRKESYKPESLSAYVEGKAKVQGTENSLKSVTEAMKNAGVQTGRDTAIARLQEERLAKKETRALATTTQEKGLMVTEKAKEPRQANYHESFQTLGVSDYNIDTARRNYVREMNKQINLADKGDKNAVQKIQELKTAWGDLAPHYTPKLVDKIEEKKLATKAEKVLAKADSVKDLRTLKAAKADLFHNEGRYLEKGMTNEQIGSYDKKLSKAIDNLKNKQASKVSVETMSKAELEKESRRLTSKEELNDADLKKLRDVNSRLFKMREEGVSEGKPLQAKETSVISPKKEVRTPEKGELAKRLKEAKTPEEKRAVMREIQKNVHDRMAEAKSKKEVLDIPEPTKEELEALEKEMENDTEYSMRIGGVAINNKFDLGLFRKAEESGSKPYSFSQLSQDASDVFSKAYEKLTGKKITFKEGGLSAKEIKGEAKHRWGVARTDENDVFTKTHEWAHFVTKKDAGFDTEKVLSKEAKSEILTWYKITHSDMKLDLREAVAEGIAYMTKNPESAFYYLRRFGVDIEKNAPKEITTAMKDVNGLINRLDELDPISSVSGLQEGITYHEPKTGVFQSAKEAGLWVLSKIKKTMPLYGHKFLPAELRQIEYSLFHGALNPYYAGTLKLDGKAKEAFLKFSKLPENYKSWEELQINWADGAKKYKEFKGMSQNAIKDKMNTDIGNYLLAKHALERENLIGLAADKGAEKAKAEKIVQEMDAKMPWAKTGAEDVSNWWRQTTDSIQERFQDVLTPNQRMILKQKLGYQYYVPILRREGRGVSSYKMSQGGTGAIYPAMENYVAKLDKILSDAANRKAKATFIKSAEKALKRGDVLGIEDVTTKMSEARKQEYYDAANEIFGMTEDELLQAKKDGTLKKAISGIRDLYNGDKFMPDNLMYAVVDGKERVFEVDPLVANMFKSSYNPYWAAATASFADRGEMVRRLVEQKFPQNKMAGKIVGNTMFALLKPFTAANKVARYGIIHNPVFMINNAARDFAESLKRSDASMSAFSVAYFKDTLQRTLKPFMGDATKDMLKEVDALYELAKSRDSLYMRAIGDGRNQSLRGAYSELYNRGFNWKKFGNAIENATEVTESRARKTTLRLELEKEYKKGLRLGDLEEDKLIEIIQKANEISVDWSAHGDLSKYLSLAPFGRATATGTASDLQFFVQKPSQYIMRTGATILPLTLGVYALNNRNSEVSQVWNAIDPKQKETYWFFILGKRDDGSYAIKKVAKPKSVGGTVVSNMEFVMDRFREIDPKRGYYFSSALYDSIFGSGSNLLKQGFGMDYSSYLNPLEQSWIEEKTNKKTYWGTDIVSPYFQTKEPVAQQNEFSSWFAKALGNATNSSPMVIDNYLRNIGGTLGSQYISETAEVKGGNPAKGLANMFNKKIIESATTLKEPVGYNSNEVKNFYEEYDKMKAKYDSVKQYSLSDQVKLKKYESAYSDTKQTLSDYYDKIRDIRSNKTISNEEKDKQMTALNKKMTEKVRQFNKTPARNEFLKSGLSLRLQK